MSQVRSVVSLDSIAVAEEQILLPAGLDLNVLRRALDALMSTAIDYGDLYFQASRYETWSVEDGIVKEGVYSIDQGVGVRAVAGEKTGFAYADAIDEDSLLDAVCAARGIARTKGGGRAQPIRRRAQRDSLYPPIDPLPSMTDRAKVDLLADLDKQRYADLKAVIDQKAARSKSAPARRSFLDVMMSTAGAPGGSTAMPP